MSDLSRKVIEVLHTPDVSKQDLIGKIIEISKEFGYTVADVDTAKPWGGFVRFEYGDGDNFVNEFFAGVDPVSARLGNPDAQLSPKFLVVAPGERLSWQVHARRAEKWVFLTDGGYYRSTNPDVMGELRAAQPGEVVQFAAGECHRLVGATDGYTIVAEIWQHTDRDHPSNEEDITRLQDDYKR